MLILTPTQLLWEAFGYGAITSTFSPLSIANYSFIQLSELEHPLLLHRIEYFSTTIHSQCLGNGCPASFVQSLNTLT